ncbi:MAG TPA: hypothetical protein EYP17_04755 [Candidatus Latescibacteria bacterium]|nr:hypothetical protein [Candidatus Latescibacterota bacterium]
MNIGWSWIWDTLFLLTIMLFILGSIAQGLIPVHFGALALAGLVVLRAIGRGRGGHLGRLVRRVFVIGLPITALLVFAVAYGQGDPEEMMAILVALGALLIALLGLYMMVRALFS